MVKEEDVSRYSYEDIQAGMEGVGCTETQLKQALSEFGCDGFLNNDADEEICKELMERVVERDYVESNFKRSYEVDVFGNSYNLHPVRSVIKENMKKLLSVFKFEYFRYIKKRANKNLQ